MLVEKAEYLSAGIHIGMKSCTRYMKKFVYKIREDGLAVFNLQEVDERIKIAGDFLSKFSNIIVVSHKPASGTVLNKFSEITGIRVFTGRFSPGTLTNPSYKGFFEPDALLVIDPLVDKQAITEAKKKRIPIVAFCDTMNEVYDVDLIVPMNNNGKKAIALTMMVLAKKIMKNAGKIKKDSEFKYTLKDFGIEDRDRQVREDLNETLPEKNSS